MSYVKKRNTHTQACSQCTDMIQSDKTYVWHICTHSDNKYTLDSADGGVLAYEHTKPEFFFLLMEVFRYIIMFKCIKAQLQSRVFLLIQKTKDVLEYNDRVKADISSGTRVVVFSMQSKATLCFPTVKTSQTNDSQDYYFVWVLYRCGQYYMRKLTGSDKRNVVGYSQIQCYKMEMSGCLDHYDKETA